MSSIVKDPRSKLVAPRKAPPEYGEMFKEWMNSSTTSKAEDDDDNEDPDTSFLAFLKASKKPAAAIVLNFIQNNS